MIKLAKAALGWITGNRSHLTLLLIAIVGAALYVRGEIVRVERDEALGLGDKLCVAAGTRLQPAGETAKRRGTVCLARIAQLAAFERETQSETSRTLSEALGEQQSKARADLAAMRQATAGLKAAATNMEKTNAQIGTDNQVGGSWFDDLNHLGGLRTAAP